RRVSVGADGNGKRSALAGLPDLQRKSCPSRRSPNLSTPPVLASRGFLFHEPAALPVWFILYGAIGNHIVFPAYRVIATTGAGPLSMTFSRLMVRPLASLVPLSTTS